MVSSSEAEGLKLNTTHHGENAVPMGPDQMLVSMSWECNHPL